MAGFFGETAVNFLVSFLYNLQSIALQFGRLHDKIILQKSTKEAA